MTCLFHDLKETIAIAKDMGVVLIKHSDNPLIREWARRNKATKFNRRDIIHGLFGIDWLPDETPVTEQDKDPNQIFWLVPHLFPTYHRAKHEYQLIKALAKAIYTKNLDKYYQVRQQLNKMGYADYVLNEA